MINEKLATLDIEVASFFCLKFEFVARRNDVTTNWEKFDYYSLSLAVIVRNDYQVIDEVLIAMLNYQKRKS